jgi:hypothetical protein
VFAAWIATSPNPAEQSLNAGQKIGTSRLSHPEMIESAAAVLVVADDTNDA